MRFALFFSIIQSMLLLGHWFFYRTLVAFLGVTNSSRLLVLKIVLGILSISLISTSFVASRYINFFVRCLYTAAASWVGIVYLLILASFVCWVFYGFGRLFHLPIDRKILMEILLGAAVVMSLYGIINSEVTRVTRLDLKLRDLPAAWKGKTAVWVSDTHLG